MSFARAAEGPVAPLAAAASLAAAPAVDLALRYGQRRQRRALAVFYEQAGHAQVRHRQPDLPFVPLRHGRRLAAAADGVGGVGDLAADVHELAVAHGGAGLARRRAGDLDEEFGGGARRAACPGPGLGGRGGPGHDDGGSGGGHGYYGGDSGGDDGRTPGAAGVPGPGGRVRLAEFGHQVLLEDLLPGRRQVPSVRHRQQPGQFADLSPGFAHRVPPTRSPVTCSPAGPGSPGADRCNLRRARDSRERTVPTGTPSASAASA